MALTISSEITRAESELTTLRSAIDKATNAQGYTVGENTVQRQRLEELTNRETYLVNRINHLTRIKSGKSSQATAAFQ